ncbi:hypothetical protein [Pseudomonas sp. GOM6]|uniref:hypothetical protein n=1 Tax=Pseudomonas sp. GOM6 TaxID=3036944 RepID=UPI00240A5204|nr:hypothetical protein [Pseudomonas sp. GOM6]MDG1580905.1 hypothetical protein [Pseudomonas sp. GOM6]
MSKIIVLSDDKHASLVNYLKLCKERYISAEEHDVAGLIESLEAVPHGSDVAKAAVENGVTMIQFMASYGVPKVGNRFAEAAEDIYKHARGQGDDIEFDDILIVDRVLNGAWVTSNVWVYASDVGALDIADNIEAMRDFLHDGIAGFETADPLLFEKCELLLELAWDGPTGPFAGLQPIAGESPSTTITLAGELQPVTLSGLIRDVAAKAEELGYDKFQLEQLELWLAENAVALDTKFHAVTEEKSKD